MDTSEIKDRIHDYHFHPRKKRVTLKDAIYVVLMTFFLAFLIWGGINGTYIACRQIIQGQSFK